MHRSPVCSYCLCASQIEQSPDSSLAIILTPIVKNKSIQSLCRTAGLTLVGSLTLAAVSTVSQSEKAVAVGLSFNNPVNATTSSSDYVSGSTLTTNYGSAAFAGFAGYSRQTIDYTSVATGLDARVTATVFGDGYKFVDHAANYTSAGNSNGDAAFLYEATKFGKGGMQYQIDLFQSGTSFGTVAAGQDLSFLVYDVDGETNSPQSESLRIFKGNGTSGLTSYQLGSTANSLTVLADNPDSYVFGKATAGNVIETNVAGDIVLNFKNTNSVLFQFEADTISGNLPNPVFSAIDGDLSILPNTTDGATRNPKIGSAAFATAVNASASTAVPEPFTIIGTLVGGTAALRMRKKLKATSGV